MAPPSRRWRRVGLLRVFGATVAVLALLAGPWTPVQAAASPSPSRPVPMRVVSGASADRAAVDAARRFLCPNGGTPIRGGRCRGRAAFASAGRFGDDSARGWDAGLPAVTRRQAPCPSGTVQARVLFWEDAVRCVPR